MEADNVQRETTADASSFEAGIRQQRELMQQMAGRENWEGESRFVIQMRRLGRLLLQIVAFAGIAFIVWAIFYVVTNS
ncbi:MAG: hypothetical protein ACR2N7_02650 [Acidimicrobiia bacterium]